MLEIYSAKWSDEDFDRMLSDVSRRAAALPFVANMGAGALHRRDARDERRIRYHAFVYLRSTFDSDSATHSSILSALREVLRDPNTQFETRVRDREPQRP